MFCKIYKGTLKGLLEQSKTKYNEMCKANSEFTEETPMEEANKCNKKMFYFFLKCLHCKMCCYEMVYKCCCEMW